MEGSGGAQGSTADPGGSGGAGAGSQSYTDRNGQDPSQSTVPERDLIAVKQKHEEELKGIRSQLSTANAEASRLRASVEQLQKSGQDTDALRTQLQGLTAERDEARKSSGDLNNRLLELRRREIAVKHSVVPDALKDKDMSALDIIDEALSLKSIIKAQNYDGGGTGTGGNAKVTPRQKIVQGLVDIQ